MGNSGMRVLFSRQRILRRIIQKSYQSVSSRSLIVVEPSAKRHDRVLPQLEYREKVAEIELTSTSIATNHVLAGVKNAANRRACCGNRFRMSSPTARVLSR